MSLNLVGSTCLELQRDLLFTEDYLSEGDSVEISLITETAPSEEQIEEWYNAMLSKGFHVTRPYSISQDGYGITSFAATKGSPILAALFPIIPAVLTMGLIAYGITRIGDITKAILPVVLAVGGTVVFVAALLRKPASQAMTLYAEKKLSK